jgi:hypothetical protein
MQLSDQQCVPVSLSMRLLRLALVLLGALGLGVSASPVEAQEAPRFLVEKISVVGASGATAGRIVVSSSLLVEGKAYTEAELREAVYRIRRLPFVLDADFALEKGSERGRFELRITVEEPKKVFLEYDAHYDLTRVPRDRPSPSFDDRLNDSFTLGVRQFVGANGLAFATVDQDRNASVGYTRYGLWGRGATASLTAANNHQDDSRSLSLVVAVPVVGDHAIQSWSSWYSAPDVDQLSQALIWRYDSTDDPLFPRTGVVASGGLPYSRWEDRRFDVHTNDWDPNLGARKFWALTPRQSVSLGGVFGWDRRDEEEGIQSGFRSRALVISRSVALDIGHLVELDRWQNSSSRRELWLSTSAGFGTTRTNARGITFESRYGGATVELIFRNAWGIVRCGLTYTDFTGRVL